MTERQADTASEPARDQGGSATPRRRYEAPKLVDYGSVAKLTQTGGSTLADAGANMMRA
jgi:hypothetical protein